MLRFMIDPPEKSVPAAKTTWPAASLPGDEQCPFPVMSSSSFFTCIGKTTSYSKTGGLERPWRRGLLAGIGEVKCWDFAEICDSCLKNS
jgi:hypothetical protein